MVNLHDDPIELVPSRYEAWRKRYEAERHRVVATLAAARLDDAVHRIDHVGSTAVPDLAAKDIVDIDVVVDDGMVDAVSRALVDELGGDRARGEEWHPVFREADGQRFNDHVFAASSDGWKRSVATREVLRVDDALREEYEALKRELSNETDDIETYSVGKTAFIGRVLDRAREDDVALGFAVPETA